MGRSEYPLTRPYLSGYPIMADPLICRAGKGQKMVDPQGAGRISQMVNRAGTRPVPTPTLTLYVKLVIFFWRTFNVIQFLFVNHFFTFFVSKATLTQRKSPKLLSNCDSLTNPKI